MSFRPNTHQGRVIVERGGENGLSRFAIEMTPAEASKAKEIVGIALSMIGLDTIPPHIISAPFVVRFYPNQVMALERQDETGSMPFRRTEGDSLITSIQMALDMAINEQTHGRAVRAHPIQTNFGMASEEPL